MTTPKVTVTLNELWPSYFGPAAPQFKTNEERLKHDLDAAMQRLRALEQKPTLFATVVAVDGEKVALRTGNELVEVARPAVMPELVEGATVRVLSDKPSIIGVVKDPIAIGNVVVVTNLVDDRLVEVDAGGGTRAVLAGRSKPRVGDRVLLDVTNSVIVRNLGRPASSVAFTGDTGVSWDDIGGLADAKRALIEAIEEPFLEKAIYSKYGQRRVRGILLHGPPGCGKTMLGKAAATALAKLHGKSARASGFQYVKGPELLSHWVGGSESNIRSIFAAARAHHEREGYPAIILVDEADALMGKRGVSRFEGMERTIVPQFLAEMDGLEDAGAMVILATNRPDTLDPAVVRDGRVDRKIHVRRPNEDETREIVVKHLKGRPLAKGATINNHANAAAGELFDDRNALYVIRTKSGNDKRFGLRDLVNGAMIAGVVDRATQLAIRRERTGGKASGISVEDLLEAVHETLVEADGLNHGTELREVVDELGDDVTEIAKAKR